jgi:hypothetical protein
MNRLPYLFSLASPPVRYPARDQALSAQCDGPLPRLIVFSQVCRRPSAPVRQATYPAEGPQFHGPGVAAPPALPQGRAWLSLA